MGEPLNELCFSNVLIDNENSGTISIKKHFIQEETNLINLKRLLSLDKVEEVRLVYIKNYYDEESVIDNIARVLKG